MTRIIIDSTCDLPESFAEDNRFTVLPLHVIIDGKEYRDRVDITTKDVYNAMRQGKVPSTAQVSFGDTRDSIEEVLKQGDDVICLSFSSKLSGTYNVIKTAAQELALEYPDRKIHVMDTRGGSLATGLIAMEAAKQLKLGAAFDSIVRKCAGLISNVAHIFVINDLSWLIKNGRLSRTLGFTANLLNIKPILHVDNGEIEVIHKVRGYKNAMEKVAALVVQHAGNCTKQLIGITHADDVESAEKMHGLLKKVLPQCEFIISEIGAVLGAHLGIGGVGVFLVNNPA